MKGIKNKLKERIALLRLRQGDTEAFGFIYDAYAERIFRYVHFRISDRGMAHDIVQEVFLKTWEYIVNKNPIESLQSFLYRVAYHKVVDYYRVKERQTVLIADQHEEPQAAGADGSQLEMHFLMKQVRSLKLEYQDVLILRYVEALSPAEIAVVLEKEVNNVRVTLHRALQALKEINQQTQTTSESKST